MRTFKLLVIVAVLAMFATQEGEAWRRIRLRINPIRILIRLTIRIIRRIRDKNENMADPTRFLCQGLTKAMIKRDEWKAQKPRKEQRIDNAASNVVVHHTGPDTCDMLGLSGSNCERCLQDESCVKELIIALQNDDLSNGMDDIGFNFLIGQDGVIYEGRGWGVVGQHTEGYDASSIGVAMIGDFTKSEPSEAAQKALEDLITCGGASGKISRNADFITEPEMSGRALDDMIQRCHGLCTE